MSVLHFVGYTLKVLHNQHLQFLCDNIRPYIVLYAHSIPIYSIHVATIVENLETILHNLVKGVKLLEVQIFFFNYGKYCLHVFLKKKNDQGAN